LGRPSAATCSCGLDLDLVLFGVDEKFDRAFVRSWAGN
jgi:hypothetical protein